jgi:hypothetical protein
MFLLWFSRSVARVNAVTRSVQGCSLPVRAMIRGTFPVSTRVPAQNRHV